MAGAQKLRRFSGGKGQLFRLTGRTPRAAVAPGSMRSVGVVVDPPALDFFAGFAERIEGSFVAAFVSIIVTDDALLLYRMLHNYREDSVNPRTSGAEPFVVYRQHPNCAGPFNSYLLAIMFRK